MTVTVETLEKLERRITLTLPAQEIDHEVESRLKKLSRTVKADGFRPGKVPMSVVAQRYGYSVHYEVMNDKVGQVFSDAVNEAKLRVAGAPKIAEFHFGIDLEGRIERNLTFRGAFLLGDARRAGNPQLGLVDGFGEDLADLVVHHLVVNRIPVATRHHAHRHLAGAKAVSLDGPRQAPETRLDFRGDRRGGQRQRDATLEFVEGFYLNGHDVLVFFDDGLVRGGGLEPPRHCWRQDLNLVRLPISPPAPGAQTTGPCSVTGDPVSPIF